MNITPELQEYLDWFEENISLIPPAWTIEATHRDGHKIGVCKSAQESQYSTLEDAERGLQEVLKWAKSARIVETHNEEEAQKLFQQYKSVQELCPKIKHKFVYVLFYTRELDCHGNITCNSIIKIYDNLDTLNNFLRAESSYLNKKIEIQDAKMQHNFDWVVRDGKYVGRIERHSVIEWEIPHTVLPK